MILLFTISYCSIQESEPKQDDNTPPVSKAVVTNSAFNIPGSYTLLDKVNENASFTQNDLRGNSEVNTPIQLLIRNCKDCTYSM